MQLLSQLSGDKYQTRESRTMLRTSGVFYYRPMCYNNI